MICWTIQTVQKTRIYLLNSEKAYFYEEQGRKPLKLPANRNKKTSQTLIENASDEQKGTLIVRESDSLKDSVQPLKKSKAQSVSKAIDKKTGEIYEIYKEIYK